MESTPLTRRSERLRDTVRKLVRRRATANLSKLLGKIRPEDVAVLMDGLTEMEQHTVFDSLIENYPESVAKVLSEMELSQTTALLERLTSEQIHRVLDHAPVDLAVSLLESVPSDLQERLLELVDRRDLSELQTQLSYPEETAGRIMTTEFFALPEATTASEAIAAIQRGGEVEMIFYLYVVDRDGHLVGVTSLRQLLLNPPDQELKEFMTRSVIKVTTDTDQEELAQLAARYDLLAIPVTDQANRLVGIVTVDDIIDIFKEEATEDFFKMVGTSEGEFLYQERSWRVAGIRLPWILVNLVGLVISGVFVTFFELSFEEAALLLLFVPVIMGMGGNIGSQTSTITVRGLATGTIPEGRVAHFLNRQVRVGAILGVVSGILVALVALFLHRDPYYPVVVGSSLFLAIVAASLNGAVIPLVFQRLGIDPAVAAGPIVTTSSDVVGILIYFGLASALIQVVAQ